MIKRKQEIDRITQLDGLRGVAAIMVLALHFQIENSFLTNNFFVRQSWLFVDFFFVLSGFIIATNYFEKISNFVSLINYIKKRFIRLFPLLFFTVIIYFIYTFLGLTLGLKIDASPVGFYIMETFDSLLFLNSTKLLGETQGMNPPSWSISAEMISYILFGLVMVLFKNLRMVFFFLIIIVCMLFMVMKNDYAFQNGDFGFVRGLLGFTIGILTYNFSPKIIFNTHYFEIPVLTLLFFSLYFTYTNHGEYNRVQYLLMPLLFAITIYIFRYSRGLISILLKSKVFQYLGKISYSIYLNHYLLATILLQVYLNILHLPALDPYSTYFFLFYVFCTILFSNFTYKYIEILGGKFLKGLLSK